MFMIGRGDKVLCIKTSLTIESHTRSPLGGKSFYLDAVSGWFSQNCSTKDIRRLKMRGSHGWSTETTLKVRENCKAE